MDDETAEPPATDGVFRRLAHGRGRAAGVSFALVEELFGPTRHEARIQQEEQRRLPLSAPSPTDPPRLTEPRPPSRSRPQGRFGGTVVVRRPPA